MIRIAAGLLLFALLTTCSTTANQVLNTNVYTYWVNSSRVPCVGVGPQSCLQIKKGNDLYAGEWENFYSAIEGFTYEPGYIYQLQVRETPRLNAPQDASSINYVLVQEIEKRRDESMRLNDIWALEQIGDETIDFSDASLGVTHPNIEFNLAERRVMGTNGCNNFSGLIVQLSPEELSFGPLSTTRKACANSEIPNRINDALEEVAGYAINGLKLTLVDENGDALLRYRKVD